MFGCALIVLFAIDLEHHLLPNAITLPGIVVGFLFSFFNPPGWRSSLIGIVVGGGVLFLIAEGYYRLRHEEGLGMGDVKMLAMIGAFLGWQLTLLSLMLASFAGTIIGVAHDRDRARHHEIRAAVRHVPGDWRRGLRRGRTADSRLVSEVLVTEDRRAGRAGGLQPLPPFLPARALLSSSPSFRTLGERTRPARGGARLRPRRG